MFSGSLTHKDNSQPFPAPLRFFSLSLLLRAETSARSVSTRRSLSSTSLHAFCPTGNTKNECVKQRRRVKTHRPQHLLSLLTCSSDCRESFILFTSLTSLSSPLAEKNLELEQREKTHLKLHERAHGCDVNGHLDRVQGRTRVSSWWGYSLRRSTERTPSSKPTVPVNPGCWPAQGHSWTACAEQEEAHLSTAEQRQHTNTSFIWRAPLTLNQQGWLVNVNSRYLHTLQIYFHM